MSDFYFLRTLFNLKNSFLLEFGIIENLLISENANFIIFFINKAYALIKLFFIKFKGLNDWISYKIKL
jgi:hypothetical protein